MELLPVAGDATSMPPSAVRNGPISKISVDATCMCTYGVSQIRKELSCADRRS
jgi:hypothetical protein